MTDGPVAREDHPGPAKVFTEPGFRRLHGQRPRDDHDLRRFLIRPGPGRCVDAVERAQRCPGQDFAGAVDVNQAYRRDADPIGTDRTAHRDQTGVSGDDGHIRNDLVRLLKPGILRQRNQPDVVRTDISSGQTLLGVHIELRRSLFPAGDERMDDRGGDEGVVKQKSHGALSSVGDG